MDNPGSTGSGGVARRASHYRRPGRSTRLLNWVVRSLATSGVSLMGTRVIEVRGRVSGEPRTTVVNLLDFGGHQYLVSPRGTTDWVRNLRADEGRVVVRLGRRRAQRRAIELADGTAKFDVLRAYLKKWRFEVGVFFEDVGPGASDAEFAAIGARHPVFQLS